MFWLAPIPVCCPCFGPVVLSGTSGFVSEGSFLNMGTPNRPGPQAPKPSQTPNPKFNPAPRRTGDSNPRSKEPKNHNIRIFTINMVSTISIIIIIVIVIRSAIASNILQVIQTMPATRSGGLHLGNVGASATPAIAVPGSHQGC